MTFWPTSLQQKIRGVVYTLSVLLLLFSGFTFHTAWQKYYQARELEESNQTAAHLAEALKGLTFERGRMHVVLNTSLINAENQQFIRERRKMADENLDKAILRLKATHPEIAKDLSDGFVSLSRLRESADSQAQLPFSKRDPIFLSEWITQSTHFIYHVENVIRLIGKAQTESGQYFLFHQLSIDSMRFRILAGHQATLVTAGLAIQNSARFNTQEISLLKSQIDYLWSEIGLQVADINKPEITRASDKVYAHYFRDYRSEQELLLILAQQQEVGQDAVMRLQDMSIAAFDSIFLLTDAVDVEIKKYVLELRRNANWMFAAAAGQLLFCLLLISFVIRYLNRRVFQPLQSIVYSLEQISHGERADFSANYCHDDEITQLAKVVELLQTTMAEERRLKTENERLALTDFLTGCLNKRAFYLQAEAELNRAAREKTTVSFVFTDLDNLKLINDSLGHINGDEAVKHFVSCILAQCRPYDLVGRFGGDEFVCCFPGVDGQQTLAIVNRVRAMLENTDFFVNGGQTKINLCASFGIVTTNADAIHNAEWYIHQADLALYRAKQSGKNCIMLGCSQAGDGIKMAEHGQEVDL